MIEPVSAYGARPQIELNAGHGCCVEPEPNPADPAAKAQFEEMLQSDEIRVAQADNANVATEVNNTNGWVIQPGPAEALPPPTVGEVLKGELQDMRENWNDVRDKMELAQGDSNISIDGLMQLSMEFQHSSMMVTLLMNQATALTQEVSKLMRAS